MDFFIVPENIAIANQGRAESGKGLSFRQDNQGRYVVNVEVAEHWPDIDWASFEIVELTLWDFPQPEI